MDLLFGTRGSAWALTISRVALAVLMGAHGLWKLGWFGGPGFENSVRFLTETLHIPGPVALVVIGLETVGAVLLAVGAFTRIAAAGVIAIMIGAIATVHLPHGFFMNWSGTAAGEGYELHLLVIAVAAQLVVYGGGNAALDPFIARFRKLYRPVHHRPA